MWDVFQDREIDVEQNLLNEKMKKDQAESANKKLSGFSEILAWLSLPKEANILDISEGDLITLRAIISHLLTNLSYVTEFLKAHPDYVFRATGTPLSPETLVTFLDLCGRVSATLSVILLSYKNNLSYRTPKDLQENFNRYMKIMKENGEFPPGSFDVFTELLKEVLDARLVKVESL